jgi:hypothetical protein
MNPPRRRVVATPLFASHLAAFLDDYAAKGAVRFVERLHESYRAMLDNLVAFEAVAPARRRHVGDRTITVREYVLDAGARTFLVLYWVPRDEHEPIVLLNIRIGGQNRFRWKG